MVREAVGPEAPDAKQWIATIKSYEGSVPVVIQKGRRGWLYVIAGWFRLLWVHRFIDGDWLTFYATEPGQIVMRYCTNDWNPFIPSSRPPIGLPIPFDYNRQAQQQAQGDGNLYSIPSLLNLCTETEEVFIHSFI